MRCLAAQIVPKQNGQRVLSYSRNRVEMEPKKQALIVERRATWLARLRREDVAAEATAFNRVCGDHFISGR